MQQKIASKKFQGANIKAVILEFRAKQSVVNFVESLRVIMHIANMLPSNAQNKLSVMFNKAVVVLRWLRKPDWRSGEILLFNKWGTYYK